jgi:hypothetical protein
VLETSNATKFITVYRTLKGRVTIVRNYARPSSTVDHLANIIVYFEYRCSNEVVDHNLS